VKSNSAEPHVNYFWKGRRRRINHVQRGHQDNYFVQPPLPHRPFFYNWTHPAPAHFYGVDMRSRGTIQSNSVFVGIRWLDTLLWRLWLILGHLESFVSVVFYPGLAIQVVVEGHSNGKINYSIIAVNPNRISTAFKEQALEYHDCGSPAPPSPTSLSVLPYYNMLEVYFEQLLAWLGAVDPILSYQTAQNLYWYEQR